MVKKWMKIGRLQHNSKKELPMVPMTDVVMYPFVVAPFFLKQPSSVAALEKALKKDRDLLVCYKKERNSPQNIEDFFSVATVCHILQVLKLPDGNMRVLVEGRERASLLQIQEREDYVTANYKIIEENNELDGDIVSLMQALQSSFAEYSKLKKKVPREVLSHVKKADTPARLISHIAGNLNISMEQKIFFLEDHPIKERLEELAVALQLESEFISLKQNINGRVRSKMEKTQKEYFLNEQLKEINKELGAEDDDASGSKELEKRLAEKKMPTEARQKGEKELKRLTRLQPMSPESGVLRTYVEWLVDLPWNHYTKDFHNLKEAHRILERDHYDLKKAKERILDFIAVQQLNERSHGPILCLTGPPGTGKTSLGRSVARALNREFVRISLGGVRDEAEIRGHRKTYVGALPGRIIQSLKKAGSSNPVFLLDEIDKMSNDFRGDPAAALLEVLDPEQNSTFTDHYLEVPYDLSRVMFITTANSLHTIPRPLLDRMEIIEIPGYTEFEKLNIAREFIIPKQLKANGISGSSLSFSDEAIRKIITKYTMEAGVRNLEKQISQVIRKLLRKEVSDYQTRPGRYVVNSQALHQYQEEYSRKEGFEEEFLPPENMLSLEVNETSIEKYLGKPLIDENDFKTLSSPGFAIGMAWTEVGGRILPVEVALLPGKGNLILTGKLGDVMKESAQIALSYIRHNAEMLGIPSDFSEKNDIHIHVPEGAIPKDGPSAGITMTSAIVSALLNKPLRKEVAMTGEITLTGRVLPIGGVKEKVLAAHRHHLKHIILPEKNRKDQDDLPEEIRKELKFHFYTTLNDALKFLIPSLGKKNKKILEKKS